MYPMVKEGLEYQDFVQNTKPDLFSLIKQTVLLTIHALDDNLKKVKHYNARIINTNRKVFL